MEGDYLYSVKIIFKYQVENGMVFYEESIVLFNAASFEDAYEKAEKYVKEYISKEYTNIYGQKVVQSVERYADCFLVYPEEDATEVYSGFFMNRNGICEKEYIDLLADTCTAQELKPLRSLEFGHLEMP
jgi:hypothetical protein